MELSDLIALQASFDERHGWSVKRGSGRSDLDAASRELVGLMGEVGEFANQIKKAVLVLDRKGIRAAELELRRRRSTLGEEIVDAFIYILRLSALLGVDLETEYVRKLRKNETRFRGYLRARPRPRGTR